MKKMLTEKQAIRLFRLVMPVFMLIHGITRTTKQEVGNFGDYLETLHLPGNLIAWALTAIEIIGSILIMCGFFVPLIAVLLIIELLMGIILVHASSGWFVVGGGSGGVEYSVLLIVCYGFLFVSHAAKLKKMHKPDIV